MPFWVLFDNILKRGSLNSVNLQESSVDLTPFSLFHDQDRRFAGSVAIRWFTGDACGDEAK